MCSNIDASTGILSLHPEERLQHNLEDTSRTYLYGLKIAKVVAFAKYLEPNLHVRKIFLADNKYRVFCCLGMHCVVSYLCC